MSLHVVSALASGEICVSDIVFNTSFDPSCSLDGSIPNEQFEELYPNKRRNFHRIFR